MVARSTNDRGGPTRAEADLPQPALQCRQIHPRGRQRSTCICRDRAASCTSPSRIPALASRSSDIVKLGRPFEQVENQFSKSHQGSGLGLAISRALVELHGGALRITSREGQGTTVTCTLPVQARHGRRRARGSRRVGLGLRCHARELLTARSARRHHAPLRACPSGSLRASAKSGMSEARANSSFSARGASSGTNGLSRQSRSTCVSV